MHRQEMERRQQEIRKAISRLEDYIDEMHEEGPVYDSAKRDIMYLYTETENMARLLIGYWDKEFKALLDELPDKDEWDDWKEGKE